MGDDNRKPADQVENKSSDSRPPASDSVASEVRGGIEEQTQGVKDYAKARKEGLRDRDTAEHLGAQPEIFDGSVATAQRAVLPTDATAKTGSDQASDQTTTGADGVILGKGHLARNPDGDVTEVVYPDGRRSEIKYGADRQPSEVTTRLGNTYKKNEDGTWNLYDKDGKLESENVKLDIKVSHDGDIKMSAMEGKSTRTVHPDGTEHRQRPDGAEITTDINNRPIEIRQPKGDSNRVEYDSKGDPTRITDQDGNSWTKQGDKWTQRDKDGKQIDSLDGRIHVTEEGDIVRVGNDGKSYWRTNADGSGTETTKDRAIISRDPEGKVNEVIYPDGTRTEIKYDEKGPLELKTKSGSTWSRNPDGTWNQTDENGKPGIQNGEMDVKVNDKGEVSFVTKDGLESFTRKPDGSSHHQSRDGYEISKDDQDRPTEIRYPNGTTNRIEYDKAGDPSRITDQNGNSWVKDGDKWTQRDKNGKQIDSLDGRIHVTKEGDIVGVGNDGQTYWRQNLDGSRTEQTGKK